MGFDGRDPGAMVAIGMLGWFLSDRRRAGHLSWLAGWRKLRDSGGKARRRQDETRR
jgi:hypothetical protein